jgi:uncharacterized membrane protein
MKNLIEGSSYTFFGIKSILYEYNISSIGLKLSLENLQQIEYPVIIQILINHNEEFAVLTDIFDNNYYVITEDKNSISINKDDFEQQWTGNVLIPEVSEESKELNYFRNRIIELADYIKYPVVAIGCVLIYLWFFLKNPNNTQFHTLLRFFLYFCGIVISVLLLTESISQQNPFIKRICELNKKMNCKRVLDSKGSKLFGVIGWSEIGFIFFSGSLLVMNINDLFAPILFWLCALSLPYTIWSVVYQWKIVKQWCILCLSVQLLLWLLFFAFLNEKVYLFPILLNLSDGVELLISYTIPVFILWFILPLFNESQQFKYLKLSFNRLKLNEVLFQTLLKTQEILNVNDLARTLKIGKPSASLTITVVNNPYCGACSKMHERIMKLLNKYPNDLNVEFIFVGESFIGKTIKQLIACYLSNKKDIQTIYSEWFQNRDERKLKKYGVNEMDNKISKIFQAQQKWKENKKIITTPTVYVNGNKLPEEYAIEDIWLLI